MKWHNFFARYSVRHACSVSLAVASTMLLTHYFSFFQSGWMVLTAFLVCQTTRGTPLRQSVLYFFSIVVGVLLVAIVYSPVVAWIDDVLIGGFIGIACGLFILPNQPYKEFSQGVTPVLQAINSFNDELIATFLQKNSSVASLRIALLEIEKKLQGQQDMYPEWVYEVGFNPGLRAGYRFFLVNLERVTELVFSLYYRFSLLHEKELFEAIIEELEEVLRKNNELIQQLLLYFAGQEVAHGSKDFTKDVIRLEEKLKQYIPSRLDLLDVDLNNVTLVAITRDVKDMRHLLLQLLLALPSNPKH